MVGDLINPIDCSWNEDLLNEYFHPDDVKIIRGIAVSRTQRPDTYGWTFTDSGKYSVKSGFRTESLYPDRGPRVLSYGPNVKPLLAHSWKLKCSPKLRHFVWQVLSGTLPVSKNLKARGIECDLRCGICGAEEESIYHVIFECPPALQTWALSRIPSPPGIFPSSSLFTSLDHLFWRLPTDVDSEYFPWIMWYIWKNRNDKIHNNRTVSPQEILRRADVEGSLWAEAQLLVQENQGFPPTDGSWQTLGSSRVCYIDGAWREHDAFTGQGWYCRTINSEDVMIAYHLYMLNVKL